MGWIERISIHVTPLAVPVALLHGLDRRMTWSANGLELPVPELIRVPVVRFDMIGNRPWRISTEHGTQLA